MKLVLVVMVAIIEVGLTIRSTAWFSTAGFLKVAASGYATGE